MSDDQKPKPLDDLKEGLGLIFRAAKGAAQKLPTDKVEDVAKDAAKEMGRAVETIGGEIDKLWNKATGSDKSDAAKAEADADAEKKEEKKDEPPAKFDDAYAPEPPPKGPRVG